MSERKSHGASVADRVPEGSLVCRGEAVDAFVAASRNVIASDQRIEGAYPEFVDRAVGAYVWSQDGAKLIDYLCGYGTILLGHAHEEVDGAAISELRRGFATGHPKECQVLLNERLVESIPCAEMSMLLKTGSDATSAAIRLARAFTGRERVARFGYNGWHDWAAQRASGVPEPVTTQVDVFEFNDFDALQRLIERHPEQYAAILMMPIEIESPERGYLEAIREIATKYGIVLIFDEMRTGFRVSLGGYHQICGVLPDLATFGKAMANGYAISALVGRADILRRLKDVHISSTFYNNTLEMAAALATIRVIQRDDVLTHVLRLGEQLQDGLRAAIDASTLPIEVVGLPQMPFLDFGADERNLKEQFYRHVALDGSLLHPNHHWYVNAAMTDDDIHTTIQSCSDILERLAEEK